MAERFGLNNRPGLYAGCLGFRGIDWIWESKTFHMSGISAHSAVLIRGLRIRQTSPLQEAWLDSHSDTDRALRHMVEENIVLQRSAQSTAV